MNDNDKILRDAARLQTEVRPRRDLWPEIEATIAAPKQSRWTPLFAQAAAVLLLVGASSGITYFVVKGDDDPQIAVQPGYVFSEAAFGGSYNLGPGFTDARSGLASKLETQLEKLSPEDRADVEDNLAIVRDAIRQINTALENDPDNAYLQTQLVRAYREELTLMRRVSNLAQDVTTRNDI